jgi:iron complex outermembrane receptor protein
MRNALLIILMLFAAFINVYSQPTQNSLKGIITDEADNPLSNVRLTIQELQLSTTSNDKGEYSFDDISEGSYHISISHTGYANRIDDVTITSGENTQDIVLEKTLIETPVIDVTSSFQPTDISNSTYSITSIGPRTITRTREENLAQTIQNVPGINNLSTGNGIGKPVIRGLTSQSVIVVKDGVKHESQQWGDEHGPEVSTYDIDRIEILRGPASLIYGSDGIGGVVNIISKPLTFSSGRKPATYGALELNGFSMNMQGTGHLTMGLGLKNFGIKGSLGYGKSSNVMTPDGTLTIQTPDGERKLQGGELLNSATQEIQGSVTAGYNWNTRGDIGSITGIYESFNREIQIHEDPEEEPDATPNQKINTNHFELKGRIPVNNNMHLEPILSYENHIRKEFESADDKDGDNAALNLELQNMQGDIRLQHTLSKNIQGTFGFGVTRSDNKTLGEEKLIPNYDSFGYGVYLSERFEQKYYTISGGIRYDNKDQNIKETVFETDSTGMPVKVVSPRELSYNSVTGSLGFVIKPVTFLDIFANAGRGWRPPSEFDLYADGEHEGTRRFDRGLLTVDSTYKPKPEESLNFDIGVRLRNKYVTGEVSFFRNEINNFIYPAPTGQTDPESGLPIYDIRQDKSSFIGMEYSVQVQPLEWMLFSVKGDLVNTKNEVTENPLTFTPPMKNIVEVKLQKSSIGSFSNPYVNFTGKFVSAQNDTDPLEAPSEAYTLLSAGIGFDYLLSKSIVSVDLSVTNLADTKYADHLSRYRYYAMNPGRSFNLKVSVPFEF